LELTLTLDNPENYKKLVLYMAYMNTIPGIPVVYYGSEFGMSGASDPDNRRMMRFNDQLSKAETNTLAEVSKIINLRKEHTSLRHGDFYTLQADKNIYAYIRSDMNERLLVVLNKSQTSQKVNLVLPYYYEVSVLNNLITDQNILCDESNVIFKVSPMDWKIYKLKK